MPAAAFEHDAILDIGGPVHDYAQVQTLETHLLEVFSDFIMRALQVIHIALLPGSQAVARIFEAVTKLLKKMIHDQDTPEHQQCCLLTQ